VADARSSKWSGIPPACFGAYTRHKSSTGSTLTGIRPKPMHAHVPVGDTCEPLHPRSLAHLRQALGILLRIEVLRERIKVASFLVVEDVVRVTCRLPGKLSGQFSDALLALSHRLCLRELRGVVACSFIILLVVVRQGP
jgi:hypothetical protein